MTFKKIFLNKYLKGFYIYIFIKNMGLPFMNNFIK